MQVVKFREDLSPTIPVIVTIGNFDGVHLGHRALIDTVVAEAKERQCASALVTFDPHPQEVLHSEQPVYKICTPELRIRLLEETGLDTVHLIRFTREFSKLSPEEFTLRFLMEHFNLVKLVIGHDFHFGKNRSGNAEFLEKFGEQRGFEVVEIAPFQINGKTVSSTLIRKLIQEHHFSDLTEYLGRRYSIYGPVESGDQRGRELGFPTANLHPGITLPLPYGVYVTEVRVKNQKYYGVTNVGIRPTFAKSTPSVETMIFDFNEDIYGEMLEIWPLEYLRTEQGFSDVAALTHQIACDVDAAKRYIANLPKQ